MTPHRARVKGKAVGTLLLEWQRRGIGRIHRATGLPSTAAGAAKLAQMRGMLDDLYQLPRWDLLEAIRDGQLQALAVYQAFRRGALASLPTAERLVPLTPAIARWVAATPNLDTRKGRKSIMGVVLAPNPKATVGDLPDLVLAFMEREGPVHAAWANRAKEQGMAFLRDTLGQEHPLWEAVSALRTYKHKSKRARRPLEPDEFAVVLGQLGPAAQAFRAMCLTGAGPKELWGRWDLLPDRIAIHGTKTERRERVVPRVEMITRPQCSRDMLVWWCAKTNPRVTPYDARRTFSHWMELAEIPASRRAFYMGHGPKTQTQVYEQHDVSRWLMQDGAALRELLGLPRAPAKLAKRA